MGTPALLRKATIPGLGRPVIVRPMRRARLALEMAENPAAGYSLHHGLFSSGAGPRRSRAGLRGGASPVPTSSGSAPVTGMEPGSLSHVLLPASCVLTPETLPKVFFLPHEFQRIAGPWDSPPGRVHLSRGGASYRRLPAEWPGVIPTLQALPRLAVRPSAMQLGGDRARESSAADSLTRAASGSAAAGVPKSTGAGLRRRINGSSPRAVLDVLSSLWPQGLPGHLTEGEFFSRFSPAFALRMRASAANAPRPFRNKHKSGGSADDVRLRRSTPFCVPCAFLPLISVCQLLILTSPASPLLWR